MLYSLEKGTEITEPEGLASRFRIEGFREFCLSLFSVLFRDDPTGSKLHMKAIFIRAKVSKACLMCYTCVIHSFVPLMNVLLFVVSLKYRERVGGREEEREKENGREGREREKVGESEAERERESEREPTCIDIKRLGVF